MDRLADDLVPNEREEIERLLAKVETALSWLAPKDPLNEASAPEEIGCSGAFLERSWRCRFFPHLTLGGGTQDDQIGETS